jgi:hypothetical protein
MSKLAPLPIDGEVLSPLPSLEEEAEACLLMIERGRQLNAQLKRANNRARRLNEQIDDLCLALGHKLIGMRERVDAGEIGDEVSISWWEWFDRFIPNVSRKHADRWMTIAASAEPATAAIEYRKRAAAYVRAHRERQKALPLTGECKIQAEPDPEPPYTPAKANLGDRRPMLLHSWLDAFQNQLLASSPAHIVALMTPEMQQRLLELGPQIAEWLSTAAQAADEA